MSFWQKALFWVFVLALVWQEPAWAENITVEVHHLRLSLTADHKLQLVETYALHNPDSEAEGREGLRFFLPAGYQHLAYGTGIDPEQVVLEGNELILKQPLPQGTSTYSLSYQLELTGDNEHYLIEKGFPYATEQFFVMSEEDRLKVVSQDLLDQGILAMGDFHFRVYTASDLPEGASMAMAVIPSLAEAAEMMPAPGTGGPAADFRGPVSLRRQAPLLGFLILVSLAFPLGALFWSRARKSQQQGANSPAEAGEELLQSLQLEEKVLKRKILELEEQLAAGSLAPEEHSKLLDFCKQKLIEVSVRLRSFSE